MSLQTVHQVEHGYCTHCGRIEELLGDAAECIELHQSPLLRHESVTWSYGRLTVAPDAAVERRLRELREVREPLRFGAEAGYRDHTGVLVGTDRRLLFAGSKGLFRKRVVDLTIGYHDITRMSVTDRRLLDDLVIHRFSGEPIRMKVNGGSYVRTRHRLAVERRRALEHLYWSVVSLLDQHERTLWRRRRQLVVRDAYGIEDIAQWEKEVDHFLEAVVGGAVEKASERLDLTELRAEIERRIEVRNRAAPSPVVDVIVASNLSLNFFASFADLGS